MAAKKSVAETRGGRKQLGKGLKKEFTDLARKMGAHLIAERSKNKDADEEALTSAGLDNSEGEDVAMPQAGAATVEEFDAVDGADTASLPLALQRFVRSS